MDIVLASKSPRRISIMKEHGYNPVVIPSEVEENIPINNGAIDTPLFLSFKKAADVETKIDENKHPYIIAADTVVYSDRIIGKPSDKEDALNILMDLSGKKHQVITGVSILKAHTSVRKSLYCITDVYFKKYTKEDIEDYLETDEPYDKAGAYAIQGYFKKFIEKTCGSYENVVGFPWEQIQNALEELDG